MDLALSNLKRSICHKTQQTKPIKRPLQPKILCFFCCIATIPLYYAYTNIHANIIKHNDELQ